MNTQRTLIDRLLNLRFVTAALFAVALAASGCVYELDPSEDECCDAYGCYACIRIEYRRSQLDRLFGRVFLQS